jgi:hypothetical protein
VLAACVADDRVLPGKSLAPVIEEEPNTDDGTRERAFVIHDLDRYHVSINESS